MLLTRDEDIAELLRESRTIALKIASPKPHRDSNKILKYLLGQGYEVWPINPGHAGETLHGQKVHASLEDLPAPPDMVDIFRRSQDVGPIVDSAIRIGARSIWMQLRVIDEEAAGRASKAGLKVVMDRCPAIDIPQFRQAGLMEPKSGNAEGSGTWK